jgi:hypothetical protein
MEQDVQPTISTSADTTDAPVANQVQEPVAAPKVEPSEKPAQQANTSSDAKIDAKEKVFNQAQLDEIVVTRLGKERARLLKKLGLEDETQLDDVVEKAKKYQDVAAKLEQYETEKLNAQKLDVLAELKADQDFTDYLLAKIEFGDSVETFKANAIKYLESNPRFKVENFKKVDSSVSLNKGSGTPDFENMTTEQYLQWRAKNKL